MARYIGPTCRVSRRYGVDLDFKVRDLTTKCALATPPGQHGLKRKRPTEYGLQLAAKQMLRMKYGLSERPFRNLYKESARQRGVTGTVLLQLLERRLDNVVYRMGFAHTRREARQMVSHCAIWVNGARVNIPSYLVKPGDQIAVQPKARGQTRIQEALRSVSPVAWLEVDALKMEGHFKRLPDREELPSDINEQLIIEFYSK